MRNFKLQPSPNPPFFLKELVSTLKNFQQSLKDFGKIHFIQKLDELMLFIFLTELIVVAVFNSVNSVSSILEMNRKIIIITKFSRGNWRFFSRRFYIGD